MERRTTKSHHKPSSILPTFHHEAAAIDANNIAAHLSQSACDEARIQSTDVLGDSQKNWIAWYFETSCVAQNLWRM